VKRIVILISGRGSNMQALVQACRGEGWPATIAGVIASRPDAPGLDWARHQGLACEALDHRCFDSREAFDAALAGRIDALGAQVIALAGFMRVLSDAFVRRYEGRMLNVHPSLLPAFPGLATHRRALDAGCKLAGATVHFVTPTLDHGPIVLQAAVPVLPDDTEATLAARVLRQEHLIYPRALGWLVRDELVWQGGRVAHRDAAAQWQLDGETRHAASAS
jgi:phosphoribosylglycinamide formyltransferase-1